MWTSDRAESYKAGDFGGQNVTFRRVFCHFGMKNASERDKNVTLDGNCVTFTGESNGSPLNFADFRRVHITRGMLSQA